VRVAAISDIHGNLPALEAVLREVEREGLGLVVSGGDVLWGALQSECLNAIGAVDALCLAGNCERDVLGAADESSRWCRERLAQDELELVSSWPSTVELDVEGLGHVLFCHATPRSVDEIVTRITPDDHVVAALAGVDADVVVCGHTHVQMDRRIRGIPRLVNAGSVGMPYQGEPGAFWAILGPDVEFRRTSYDVEAALSSLTGSGFPDAANVYGESIRGAASADSATTYFESKRGAA
jgi:putative phosphoesterase